MKYIPVRTITCFEAFFRSVYSELIDFGEPFRENGFNLIKDLKLNYEFINAIDLETVTIGELIAYQQVCNKLDNIENNLGTILNLKFIQELEKFEPSSIFEEVNKISKNFRDDSNQIIKDVKELFRLRHILCHEFSGSLELQKAEISGYLKSAIVFLNQTDLFVGRKMYPNRPESQTDMNIYANEKFQKKEEELNKLIETIKEIKSQATDMDALDFDLFDSKIDMWKSYRESLANLESSPYEGGSIFSLIHAMSLFKTTEEKIQSMKKEFKQDLQKHQKRNFE